MKTETQKHIMNTHHTPGPWQVAESPNHHSPFITNATGKGTIANSVHGATSAEQEANARLIAAAPELLDALQTILALSTPVQTLPWEKAPVVNFAQHMDAIAAHARAAIAKATQP